MIEIEAQAMLGFGDGGEEIISKGDGMRARMARHLYGTIRKMGQPYLLHGVWYVGRLTESTRKRTAIAGPEATLEWSLRLSFDIQLRMTRATRFLHDNPPIDFSGFRLNVLVASMPLGEKVQDDTKTIESLLDILRVMELGVTYAWMIVPKYYSPGEIKRCLIANLDDSWLNDAGYTPPSNTAMGAVDNWNWLYGGDHFTEHKQDLFDKLLRPEAPAEVPTQRGKKRNGKREKGDS